MFNTKKKLNNTNISSNTILLSKQLHNIRKTIGEDVIINLISHKDTYIIGNVETVRSIKFKQKLEYDGSNDYDDSSPDPRDWGVL